MVTSVFMRRASWLHYSGFSKDIQTTVEDLPSRATVWVEKMDESLHNFRDYQTVLHCLGIYTPAPQRKYFQPPSYRQGPAHQPFYHQRVYEPPRKRRGYTPANRMPFCNFPLILSLLQKIILMGLLRATNQSPCCQTPSSLSVASRPIFSWCGNVSWQTGWSKRSSPPATLLNSFHLYIKTPFPILQGWLMRGLSGGRLPSPAMSYRAHTTSIPKKDFIQDTSLFPQRRGGKRPVLNHR